MYSTYIPRSVPIGIVLQIMPRFLAAPLDRRRAWNGFLAAVTSFVREIFHTIDYKITVFSYFGNKLSAFTVTESAATCAGLGYGNLLRFN